MYFVIFHLMYESSYDIRTFGDLLAAQSAAWLWAKEQGHDAVADVYRVGVAAITRVLRVSWERKSPANMLEIIESAMEERIE